MPIRQLGLEDQNNNSYSQTGESSNGTNVQIIQQNYNFFYPSENAAMKAMHNFENMNMT